MPYPTSSIVSAGRPDRPDARVHFLRVRPWWKARQNLAERRAGWTWRQREGCPARSARLRRKHALSLSALLVFLFALARPAGAQDALAPRTVLDLNGIWKVAQGSMDSHPPEFARDVPVPGLIDMAEPAFQDVGRQSGRREAFWYRRTFRVDQAVPATAILKIHKAKYGSKIFLNGRLVGEHLPSFTPGYLDVKPFLKGSGQDNELIVRVGANRESLPEGQPSGWDFEKYRYIPGIYDDVELVLTGSPYITNVQVVPDITTNTARFVIEVEGAHQPAEIAIDAQILEAGTDRVVAETDAATVALGAGDVTPVNLSVFIENARLWSPEDPFLYEARITTGSDAVRVRFGMRSFTFDPVTRRPLLNGEPYYLRGTNVTLYRYFEDAERADRPWRAEWVRRLHRTFKGMNWNTIRYCIGFPPDFWYDIADEEGFLIQDEFPIWLLNDAPEDPQAEQMIPEYKAWMRERWNHPSVVIWDAQNESITEETAKTIAAVRHLDLSGRPWENGWMSPESPTDAVESHPYLFSRGFFDSDDPVFRLREMPGVSGVPRLRDSQQARPASIIINEYGWLWLTRDGNPTSLTHRNYDVLLGPNATPQERRYLYGRYLAALTEFWRAHREAAGVLHFCGLGYSRPGDKPRPEGGATSDHFTDLERLTFEPYFEEFVGDAFSPVGLMLDFWAETLPRGAEESFRVYVINDLHDGWEGAVKLSVMNGDDAVSTETQYLQVEPLGREIITIREQLPDDAGAYTLAAELMNPAGERIRSLRDVRIVR